MFDNTQEISKLYGLLKQSTVDFEVIKKMLLRWYEEIHHVSINQRCQGGDTIAHRIFATGDYGLINLLLGFKPDLDIEFSGKKPPECLPANGADNEKVKVLCALYEQLKGIEEDRGVPIISTTALLKYIYDKLKPNEVKTEPAVLVMGYTGVGKSTLINQLQGVHYEVKEEGISRETVRIKMGSEVTPVGHTIISETLIPEGFFCKNMDSWLVDMPGLGDNRNVPGSATAETDAKVNPFQITMEISTYLISKKFSNIRVILVVIDPAQLAETRTDKLLKIAEYVGALMKEQSKKNIVLGISKVNFKDSSRFAGPEGDFQPIKEEIQRINLPGGSLNQKRFIEGIYLGDIPIVLLPLSSPEEAQKMLLEKLPKESIPAGNYAWEQFKRHAARFENTVRAIWDERLKQHKQILELKGKIDKYKDEKNIASRDLSLTKTIASFIPQLTVIDDKTPLIDFTKQIQGQLASLDRLLNGDAAVNQDGMINMVKQLTAETEQIAKDRLCLGKLRLEFQVANDFYQGLDRVIVECLPELKQHEFFHIKTTEQVKKPSPPPAAAKSATTPSQAGNNVSKASSVLPPKPKPRPKTAQTTSKPADTPKVSPAPFVNPKPSTPAQSASKATEQSPAPSETAGTQSGGFAYAFAPGSKTQSEVKPQPHPHTKPFQAATDDLANNPIFLRRQKLIKEEEEKAAAQSDA